jgi:hypothetical protein
MFIAVFFAHEKDTQICLQTSFPALPRPALTSISASRLVLSHLTKNAGICITLQPEANFVLNTVHICGPYDRPLGMNLKTL